MSKTDFLNPFDKGVTYEDFLASVPDKTTIEKHCEKELEPEQIEWLLVELEHFKNNNKK